MTRRTSPGSDAPTRVRTAVLDDAEPLVRWVCAVAQESEGRKVDAGIVARGVQASLADPAHRQYYVAERDGQRVGCALVTTEWSDWTATWYWWLQSIYVEPAARGTGVVAALVRHIETTARGEAVRLVRLYVHAENQRARRAYARVGYEEVPYRVYEYGTASTGTPTR